MHLQQSRAIPAPSTTPQAPRTCLLHHAALQAKLRPWLSLLVPNTPHHDAMHWTQPAQRPLLTGNIHHLDGRGLRELLLQDPYHLGLTFCL